MLGIQFQPSVDWRGVKWNAVLLAAALFGLVWPGPLWTVGFSLMGLAVSLVGFVRSLRSSGTRPPALISVVMALFHGCMIGAALLLYVFFAFVPKDQTSPPLTHELTDVSGQMVVMAPAGWVSAPLDSPTETGLTLTSTDKEKFLTIQEVKIQIKELESGQPAGNPQTEPTVNTFTVKKYWLSFHQVTVMGFKGPHTLCSVSAVTLAPHLPMAKDLCKALFKNVRLQATLRK